MATEEIAHQYFIYENRLASFQGPQPVAKRRGSNAHSRAPKALQWPHKNLAAADVSVHPGTITYASLLMRIEAGQSRLLLPSTT